MTGIKIRFWTAVSLAAGVGVFAASSEAATRVENLHLKRAGGFVELSIPVPSHLLCEHFTLPATGTKPFRIVLDFCDALHRLPQQNFENLPASVIKGVRTSQFANDPQPIVRVVLDLTEAATYSVRLEGQVVTIAVADPQGAFFSAWEANPSRPDIILPVLADQSGPDGSVTTRIGSTPKRPAQTSTQSPPVAPDWVPATETSPARSHFAWSDRESRDERDVPARRSSADKTVQKPAGKSAMSASAASGKSAVSGLAQPRKQEPLVTAMIVAETKKSPAVSKTESVSRAPEDIKVASVVPSDKPAETKKSPAVSKTVPTHSAPKSVTVASVNPSDNPKESTSPNAKSVPETPWAHAPVTAVEAPKPSKPFTLPDHPLVLAPEYLEIAQMAGQKKTRVLQGERSYPEPAVTASVDPAGQATGEEAFAVSPENSPLWASVDQTTVNQQSPVEAVPVAEVSLIDRLKTKFFGTQRSPRPYTTGADIVDETDGNAFGPPSPGTGGRLDRAALLERIRMAEQEAARRLQHGPGFRRGAPPRTEISYDDMGRRDPFDPLLGGMRSGFVTNVLPNVENLRMVGVLHDDYDALALLEDMEGHSYILRSGDPVENGVVLDVRETRVLFEVDDYGWIRTVALQLSSRGADPTKALGFNNSTDDSDTGFDDDESE